MSNGTNWEAYEIEFLRETYPSKQWTVAEIGEKLDRSPWAVINKANQHGLRRQRNGKTRKLNYAIVVRMHNAGNSTTRIARHFDCCYSAVRYALRSMGAI